MKFILEEKSSVVENMKELNISIQLFINEIISNMKINSLDFFVIAESEIEAYAEAVHRYADVVNTDTHVIQDGVYYEAGKALVGLDEAGVLHQVIIVKSSIWYSGAIDYARAQGLISSEKDIVPEEYRNKSIILLLHEIGHAIDNEYQYIMFGTVNTKVTYDLRYEYVEFVKQAVISLWGEYFAESFPYRIISSKDDLSLEKEEELINCINTYSKGSRDNEIMERVYRVLYYFVHRIAYIHQKGDFLDNFDSNKYINNQEIKRYIPIFERTEIAMKNLLKDYPDWKINNQLDEMIQIFMDLVDAEKLYIEEFRD